MRTKNISILLFVAVVFLVGCVVAPTPAQPTAESGLANPASVYCEEQGGQLEIRTGDDGGQYGVCIFSDGSECEEWAYYRGECQPGDSLGTPPPAESQYDDPFAYCAAVGTVDAPDARYNGPATPDSVIEGLIEQGVVSADAPAEYLTEATVWRCMDGQVWACTIGANLPCHEKADMSEDPTEAMKEFCEANPTADGIPAAVTGRATVYQWTCKAGEPEVVRQVFHADPQGYLAEFWYELVSQ
jgi:putative hemolysin